MSPPEAPKKSAKQFVADITKSPELAHKLFTLAKTSDDLGNFLKNEGYVMSESEFDDAVKAATSGSQFQLSSVGGLYTFDKPPDLVQQKKWLMIDPANATLYVGAGEVNLKNTEKDCTVQDGSVKWTEGDVNYSIDFVVSYLSDGAPQPTRFKGTRTGNTDSEVTGVQSTPWATTDYMTRVLAGLGIGGFIATLVGFPNAFATVKWLYRKIRGDSSGEAKKNLAEVEGRFSVFAKAIAKAFEPDVNFENLEEVAERHLPGIVGEALNQTKDSKIIRETALEKISGILTEKLAYDLYAKSQSIEPLLDTLELSHPDLASEIAKEIIESKKPVMRESEKLDVYITKRISLSEEVVNNARTKLQGIKSKASELQTSMKSAQDALAALEASNPDGERATEHADNIAKLRNLLEVFKNHLQETERSQEEAQLELEKKATEHEEAKRLDRNGGKHFEGMLRKKAGHH